MHRLVKLSGRHGICSDVGRGMGDTASRITQDSVVGTGSHRGAVLGVEPGMQGHQSHPRQAGHAETLSEPTGYGKVVSEPEAVIQ
jgi:hypothetical protein